MRPIDVGEAQTDVHTTFYVSQSTTSQLWDKYQKHRSTRDLQIQADQDDNCCYIRVRHLCDRDNTEISTANPLLCEESQINGQSEWSSDESLFLLIGRADGKKSFYTGRLMLESK